MRLELVCALLVIAVVTIGTSAEYSGSQNDVDDERSVRDAVDDDDVQSVLGDDDGRSVRDVFDGDDVQSQLREMMVGGVFAIKANAVKHAIIAVPIAGASIVFIYAEVVRSLSLSELAWFIQYSGCALIQLLICHEMLNIMFLRLMEALTLVFGAL
ncbi:hypothetical protein EMCRGX_G001593 [Ephydatia muelleri]